MEVVWNAIELNKWCKADLGYLIKDRRIQLDEESYKENWGCDLQNTTFGGYDETNFECATNVIIF